MTATWVVRVDPVHGWAEADLPRRVAAVLALPLTALLWAGGLPLLAWTVVGPALFYSLARVLRPEPRQLERTTRHLLASTATGVLGPQTQGP